MKLGNKLRRVGFSTCYSHAILDFHGSRTTFSATRATHPGHPGHHPNTLTHNLNKYLVSTKQKQTSQITI